MTLDDISDLLAICAQFDGRTVNDETPAAWLMLLEDIPPEDAADAVRTHYRTDRRWIMPADIVAHHETLARARAVEEVRQRPPACSCGVQFVLSSRPGSVWALPAGPHAEGCRWGGDGVLVFNREWATWGLMTIDPATFDEVRWEAERDALAAAAEQGGLAAALNPAGTRTDWVSRLAIGGQDLGGEDAGE